MNSIRQIQALNKRELEAGVSTSASWHVDYRDTAFIYIGGLPFELSEGDIVTIFSQFGEPVYVNLVRDKETGKSKGFAFLKYEDQRSTDLAVDNLGGAVIMGRTLRVDHTRYKKKDDEELVDNTNGQNGIEDKSNIGATPTKSESEDERPLLKEEIELLKLKRDHDDEDPMKQYLIEEKQEEVRVALKALEKRKRKDTETSEKHRHRHRHSRADKHHDQEYGERRPKSHRSSYRHRRSRSRSRNSEQASDRHYENRETHQSSRRDRSSSRDISTKDAPRRRDRSR